MSATVSNPAHNSAAHGGCPAVLGSASEYRGSRCPICFWALYDGDWCQGPKWCANRGKSVEKPIFLTNAEAVEMIRNYPCRHCVPTSKGMAPGSAVPDSESTNPADR